MPPLGRTHTLPLPRGGSLSGIPQNWLVSRMLCFIRWLGYRRDEAAHTQQQAAYIKPTRVAWEVPNLVRETSTGRRTQAAHVHYSG
jgi:hypothetical protein